MLGEPTYHEADPIGEWFAFEEGAGKLDGVPLRPNPRPWRRGLHSPVSALPLPGFVASGATPGGVVVLD